MARGVVDQAGLPPRRDQGCGSRGVTPRRRCPNVERFVHRGSPGRRAIRASGQTSFPGLRRGRRPGRAYGLFSSRRTSSARACRWRRPSISAAGNPSAKMKPGPSACSTSARARVLPAWARPRSCASAGSPAKSCLLPWIARPTVSRGSRLSRAKNAAHLPRPARAHCHPKRPRMGA